jgi:hypothetical protein
MMTGRTCLVRPCAGSISVDSTFPGRISGAPICGGRDAATRICQVLIWEGANLFKAVLDGAELAGAFVHGVQFLNCAQLVVARNWQLAFRDEALGCGAVIPDTRQSE